MRKGSVSKKKEVKRRKSYITIIIIVLFIALVCLICIKYDLKHSKVVEKVIASEYDSNLREEDDMKYEYSKINSKLKDLRAFAVSEGYIVGVSESGNLTNIIQIDENNTYDYVYYDQNLYLLEKESGKVSIIPLKTDGEYKVTQTIEFGKKVNQIQVYNKELYYLSNGTLFKHTKNNEEVVYENISSDLFIIKLDYLYVQRGSELLKIKLDTKEELVISKNVVNFEYYNYFEKNKIVYETSIDGQNYFKNILNVYSNEIINSVKNNGYFVVYGANEYVYISNDKTQVYMIEKNGNNKVIYTSKAEIEDVVFIKEGYLIIKAGDNMVTINLQTKKEKEKFEANLDNIKYIK